MTFYKSMLNTSMMVPSPSTFELSAGETFDSYESLTQWSYNTERSKESSTFPTLTLTATTQNDDSSSHVVEQQQQPDDVNIVPLQPRFGLNTHPSSSSDDSDIEIHANHSDNNSSCDRLVPNNIVSDESSFWDYPASSSTNLNYNTHNNHHSYQRGTTDHYSNSGTDTNSSNPIYNQPQDNNHPSNTITVDSIEAMLREFSTPPKYATQHNYKGARDSERRSHSHVLSAFPKMELHNNHNDDDDDAESASDYDMDNDNDDNSSIVSTSTNASDESVFLKVEQDLAEHLPFLVPFPIVNNLLPSLSPTTTTTNLPPSPIKRRGGGGGRGRGRIRTQSNNSTSSTSSSDSTSILTAFHASPTKKSTTSTTKSRSKVTINKLTKRKMEAAQAMVKQPVSRGRKRSSSTFSTGREFPCTVCAKTFISRSKVTRHMLVHSGEKKHQCIYCDARFGQKSAMHVHQRRKHMEELQVDDLKKMHE